MQTTSDQTVNTVPSSTEEQRRAAQKRAVLAKPKQSWKAVVGLLGDSQFEREAWALGESWRKEQTEP